MRVKEPMPGQLDVRSGQIGSRLLAGLSVPFLLLPPLALIGFGPMVLTCERVGADVPCTLAATGPLQDQLYRFQGPPEAWLVTSPNSDDLYQVRFAADGQEFRMQSGYTTGRETYQAIVDRINGFGDDPDQSRLSVDGGPRLGAWIIAGMGLFFGGGLLAGGALFPNTRLQLDRRRDSLSVDHRNLFGVGRRATQPLSRVEAIEVTAAEHARNPADTRLAEHNRPRVSYGVSARLRGGEALPLLGAATNARKAEALAARLNTWLAAVRSG